MHRTHHHFHGFYAILVPVVLVIALAKVLFDLAKLAALVPVFVWSLIVLAQKTFAKRKISAEIA